MPNKAIQNAKRLRAGALGQSSRFYNIFGRQVGASQTGAFKGGQGWTTHNPSIGSMLSNGIAKQNKNAGGNNVCEPGPGPTSVIELKKLYGFRTKQIALKYFTEGSERNSLEKQMTFDPVNTN